MGDQPKPLGLTLGDPAGIGPEICAKMLAQADLPEYPLVLGDPKVLEAAAKRLGLKLLLQTVKSSRRSQTSKSRLEKPALVAGPLSSTVGVAP